MCAPCKRGNSWKRGERAVRVERLMWGSHIRYTYILYVYTSRTTTLGENASSAISVIRINYFNGSVKINSGNCTPSTTLSLSCNKLRQLSRLVT